jgi:hypothetical protein
MSQTAGPNVQITDNEQGVLAGAAEERRSLYSALRRTLEQI